MELGHCHNVHIQQVSGPNELCWAIPLAVDAAATGRGESNWERMLSGTTVITIRGPTLRWAGAHQQRLIKLQILGPIMFIGRGMDVGQGHKQ